MAPHLFLKLILYTCMSIILVWCHKAANHAAYDFMGSPLKIWTCREFERQIMPLEISPTTLMKYCLVRYLSVFRLDKLISEVGATLTPLNAGMRTTNLAHLCEYSAMWYSSNFQKVRCWNDKQVYRYADLVTYLIGTSVPQKSIGHLLQSVNTNKHTPLNAALNLPV